MIKQDVLVESVRKMGHSVLGAARAWARFKGIESQAVVRHGNVEAEIIDYCRALDATYLVLGRSLHQDKAGIYSPCQFAQLVKRIGMQIETVVVFQ